MKKQLLIRNGLFSVTVIVLLLGVLVNHQTHGKPRAGAPQVADGSPLPPPVNPPPKLGGDLFADGSPLPPPVNPPPKLRSKFLADGSPLPPPVNPPPKMENS
jgi:hypothetical protein